MGKTVRQYGAVISGSKKETGVRKRGVTYDKGYHSTTGGRHDSRRRCCRFAPDSLVGFPNEIVAAVRQRFLKEGHPADITTLRAAGMGTFAEDEFGEGAWAVYPGHAEEVDFLLSGGLPYSGKRRRRG